MIRTRTVEGCRCLTAVPAMLLHRLDGKQRVGMSGTHQLRGGFDRLLTGLKNAGVFFRRGNDRMRKSGRMENSGRAVRYSAVEVVGRTVGGVLLGVILVVRGICVRGRRAMLVRWILVLMNWFRLRYVDRWTMVHGRHLIVGGDQ